MATGKFTQDRLILSTGETAQLRYLFTDRAAGYRYIQTRPGAGKALPFLYHVPSTLMDTVRSPFRLKLPVYFVLTVSLH